MSAERAGAVRVARRLREAGYEAWFAGGCVRDHLLGRPPKDWDIATDARPDEVQSIFRRTVAVGAAFGVVQVLDGDESYEVATFRADGDYVDGRRPSEVHYSPSRIEDVRRRDFTINALLMDPETGAIEDHVEGRADLEARLIRAVGVPQERFREDRLRMLRAVRFSARLGFEIEEATWSALVQEAPHLSVVSPERITQELEGILASPRPGDGIRLVESTALAKACLPARRGEALAAWLDRLPSASAAEGLSAEARLRVGWALVHAELDRKAAEGALRARRLSRATTRGVIALTEARRTVTQEAGGPVFAVARSPDASAVAALLRCDDPPAAQVFEAARARVRAHPPPAEALLDGADLRGLGLPPGPAFKRILTAVEHAALEGRIQTREEALALARGLADQ